MTDSGVIRAMFVRNGDQLDISELLSLGFEVWMRGAVTLIIAPDGKRALMLTILASDLTREDSHNKKMATA